MATYILCEHGITAYQFLYWYHEPESSRVIKIWLSSSDLKKPEGRSDILTAIKTKSNGILSLFSNVYHAVSPPPTTQALPGVPSHYQVLAVYLNEAFVAI